MRYGQQHNQGLEAKNEGPPNAPYWLFDTVVRYGQQHNQGLEAKNEGPPNAPYWRGTAK
ncbi:MAG: hypothetical protein F6K26_29995 [Moorea sp. SIO2I5]|nr:hypothetical protein [Moorena sp. SIO2I5]